MEADNTVAVSFIPNGTHKMVKVFDKDRTYLPSDLVTGDSSNNPKISFKASSGLYKLSTKIGKNSNSLDRVTLQDTPMTEISKPMRMLEIIFPSVFEIQEPAPHVNNERDIVIDVSMYEYPTRCSIFCMSHNEYNNRNWNSLCVDTSTWEVSNALKNDTHIWVWVFRKSKNDKELFNPKLYYFIPGNIKWGKNNSKNQKE